jgi:hypothetical protein
MTPYSIYQLTFACHSAPPLFAEWNVGMWDKFLHETYPDYINPITRAYMGMDRSEWRRWHILHTPPSHYQSWLLTQCPHPVPASTLNP